MKKLLVLMLVSMCVITVVSCKHDPDVSGDDMVEIVIPANIAAEPTMGLSDMHLDYFNADEQITTSPTEFGAYYSMQLAEQTMSYLPIIPGLVKHNVNKKNPEIPSYTLYGFTMDADTEATSVNNDGIFIRYKIMEKQGGKDVQVGIIDYYYSNEGKLAYREYNMLTIDMPPMGGPILPETYGLLLIELDDIEVKKEDVSKLQAGQVVDFNSATGNVTLEKNAFADLFNITTTHNNQDLLAHIGFNRRYYSMDLKPNKMCAFIHPDGSFAISGSLYCWSSNEKPSMINNPNFVSDFSAFLSETDLAGITSHTSYIFGGGDPVPVDIIPNPEDITDKKTNLGMDALWMLYKAAYGDDSDIANAKYSTYDEFVAKSVKDKITTTKTDITGNIFISEYHTKGHGKEGKKGNGFSLNCQIQSDNPRKFSTGVFGQDDVFVDLTQDFFNDKSKLTEIMQQAVDTMNNALGGKGKTEDYGFYLLKEFCTQKFYM